MLCLSYNYYFFIGEIWGVGGGVLWFVSFFVFICFLDLIIFILCFGEFILNVLCNFIMMLYSYIYVFMYLILNKIFNYDWFRLVFL